MRSHAFYPILRCRTVFAAKSVDGSAERVDRHRLNQATTIRVARRRWLAGTATVKERLLSTQLGRSAVLCASCSSVLIGVPVQGLNPKLRIELTAYALPRRWPGRKRRIQTP